MTPVGSDGHGPSQPGSFTTRTRTPGANFPRRRRHLIAGSGYRQGAVSGPVATALKCRIQCYRNWPLAGRVSSTRKKRPRAPISADDSLYPAFPIGSGGAPISPRSASLPPPMSNDLAIHGNREFVGAQPSEYPGAHLHDLNLVVSDSDSPDVPCAKLVVGGQPCRALEANVGIANSEVSPAGHVVAYELRCDASDIERDPHAAESTKACAVRSRPIVVGVGPLLRLVAGRGAESPRSRPHMSCLPRGQSSTASAAAGMMRGAGATPARPYQ
jgi:hypothetical protein